MKKILPIFMIIMLLFIPITFAQDSEEVEAGITPDSNFYFMDRWQEQVSLAFTFNKQKKAQKHLDIVNERISEMSQTQNSDDITELQTNIEKNIEGAQLNSVEDISTQIEQLRNRNKQELQKRTELNEQLQNNVQNRIANQEQNFLQEFKDDSLELSFKDSENRYFKLESDKLVEVSKIDNPTYTIEILDEQKFNDLIEKYNKGLEIWYSEVLKVADIPFSLKARVLKMRVSQ